MPLTIAHQRDRAAASPWRHVVRGFMCTAIVCVACASGSVAHAQRPSGPAPAADPFAKRGWHLELGGHGAVEAWNYNISREDLLALVPGLTYGLREGLQLTASWPMYFVSQQGPDAYLVGAAFGVRGRIYRRKHVNVFLEIKVGVSDTDTYVPPRGTRFNYLAFGGAGVTIRMRRGLHALAGVEWMHLSNGGFAGRSRNPDIEAIGPRLGVLIAF